MQKEIKEKKFENSLITYLKSHNYQNEPYSDEYQSVINFEILFKQMKIINSDFFQKQQKKDNSNFLSYEINKYLEEAINKIKAAQNQANLSEANLLILDYLKNGIKVKIGEYSESTFTIKVVDFHKIENNLFSFASQKELEDDNQKRFKVDLLIYLNGLPLTIIEFKSLQVNASLESAYQRIQAYAKRHKDLVINNLFALVSDGLKIKYGSLSATFAFWWPFEARNETSVKKASATKLELYHLLKPAVYLEFLEDFIFYASDNNRKTKYVAAFHQYRAAKLAIKALRETKDNKAGVIWHTQGSGKSLTMLFLAHLIRKAYRNQVLKAKNEKPYKIIFITDRNALDDQLARRFEQAKDHYLYEKIQRINSKEKLKHHLENDNNFGIFFSTIQKFTFFEEALSELDNIIIIADEAHRSQNNLQERKSYSLEQHLIINKQGYARYMRLAFPNAKFIGFSGTPLLNDKNLKTVDIFGDYIHTYLMDDSIRDGTTVPINYERRRSRIVLDKNITQQIDLFIKYNLLDDHQAEKKEDLLEQRYANLEAIIDNPQYISALVADFWEHYEVRSQILNGKALFVTFSRRFALKIYQEMKLAKPSRAEQIIFIVTSSRGDNKDLKAAIPSKKEQQEMALEFKKADSKYKIAIVVDKWLTGFDVPDLDTMYLLKDLYNHNLMQTIARVNRTFSLQKNDRIIKKQAGLIVDYLGIEENLADALAKYSNQEQSELQSQFDIETVKAKLKVLIATVEKKYFAHQNYLAQFLEAFENKKTAQDTETMIKTVYRAFSEFRKFSKEDKIAFKEDLIAIQIGWNLCATSLDLDPKMNIEATFFRFLKNIINLQSHKEAIDLKALNEHMRKALKNVISWVDISASEIPIKTISDINYLNENLKKLEKMEDDFEIENGILEIENEIKAKIKEIDSFNPGAALAFSQKLEAIVEDFELNNWDSKLLSVVMTYDLKELIEEIEETEEAFKNAKDQRELTFYRVLINNQNLKNLFAKEDIEKMAQDINAIVKKYYNQSWSANESLRNAIKYKIKIMLKNEYKVEPKLNTDIKESIINEISSVSEVNPAYFLSNDKLFNEN